MKQVAVLSFNDVVKVDYNKYKDLVIKETLEYDEVAGGDIYEVVFDCDSLMCEEINEHIKSTLKELNYDEGLEDDEPDWFDSEVYDIEVVMMDEEDVR